MYTPQSCSARVGCWAVRKKIDGRLDIAVLLRSEHCTPYDAQLVYGDRSCVNALIWGSYNTVMVVSPCLFSDDWNLTSRWIQIDFVCYIGSIHDTIACCVLTLWTHHDGVKRNICDTRIDGLFIQGWIELWLPLLFQLAVKKILSPSHLRATMFHVHAHHCKRVLNSSIADKY